MVRPGLAQTQAVLARELSGGTDEASRLFRQSVTLTRQIERRGSSSRGLQRPCRSRRRRTLCARERPARIAAADAEGAGRDPGGARQLPALPRRVRARSFRLPTCRRSLRAGEAYYRMTIVGDQVYAMLVTPTAARAVKLADQRQAARRAGRCAARHDLDGRERQAHDLSVRRRRCRTSSITSCSGRSTRELAGVKHLIFEPDGAMLRLPPNLLVMDQASVDAYASAPRPAATPSSISAAFSWLGRDRDISTSVSPRAFAQLRSAPRSAAAEGLSRPWREHPAGGRRPRQMVPAAADRDCILPLSSWAEPDLGAGAAGREQASFGHRSATACRSSRATSSPTRGSKRASDLDQYRIIHFATHGVVTVARAEMRGAAGAADQLRRRRVGRAADLPRDFRPSPRRRPRHPFGLRHRGQGERRGDPAGRPCDRRRRRARRPGARLRRRRRPPGDRQPLAGARRLQRDAAADHRPVLGAAGNADGDGAAHVAAPADGRRRTPRTHSIGRRSRRSATAKSR